jgi:hypothetical protein
MIPHQDHWATARMFALLVPLQRCWWCWWLKRGYVEWFLEVKRWILGERRELSSWRVLKERVKCVAIRTVESTSVNEITRKTEFDADFLFYSLWLFIVKGSKRSVVCLLERRLSIRIYFLSNFFLKNGNGYSQTKILNYFKNITFTFTGACMDCVLVHMCGV